MKNLFEMISNWFSPSPSLTAAGNVAASAPVAVPEHERRLRELAERGRVVFLP